MSPAKPLLAGLLAGALVLVPASPAARVDSRTQRVSAADYGGSDGASGRPSLSADGTQVAFESLATNLAPDANGPVRDVFLRDLDRDGLTLVSVGPGGEAGNGPSSSPVLGARGVVVFTSEASNLVAGDGNGARDVFVRLPGQPVRRVSVNSAGVEGNGPSYEPDVSRDGRFVVFTSAADNLVAGDGNRAEDVFLHDTRNGTTQRISRTPGGGSPAGASRAPAISPDGGWVSFDSRAADLVRGDTNRVADVFLAPRAGGRTRRVSVSSRERQQNRAVIAPFLLVSDVSEGGRYVAFDSDATNLVPRDRNRDTDVFVRDVRRGRTEIASLGVTGRQGDNDSYFPRLSSSGRFVAFTSFANNLYPRDPANEDLYLYDRHARRSTLLTVTSSGGRRAPEAAQQLLRRVSLSDDARMASFSTTVPLTADDADRQEDVVVRDTTPPQGRIVSGPRGTVRTRRPRLRLSADDPAARVFGCRIDGRSYVCGRRWRMPRLSRGRHTLEVRAGGPGMQFDPSPVIRRFRVR